MERPESRRLIRRAGCATFSGTPRIGGGAATGARMRHSGGPSRIVGRPPAVLRRTAAAALAATIGLGGGAALAGEASVLDATAQAVAGGAYAISATVNHVDEGWSHYADKWDVLTPDGKVLATRTLYHPHVDEQPFTRSLGRVEVPIGVTVVTIRANCSVHGPGQRTFTLKLPPRR